MADPEQERLDELGDRIDTARRQAEDDGLLTDSTPEPTLVDPDPEGTGDEGDEVAAPG